MKATPREVEDLVAYQIGALAGIAAAQGVRLTHVKPHGALYNMAARDMDLADAIGVPPENAERTLEMLWRRRLVIRQESGYVPVRSALSGLGGGGFLGDARPDSGGMEAS